MSRVMNEILADIVLASGGTITDYTRNGLLRDWAEAVESARSEWYLQFNGISAYGQFTPITIPAGANFEIEAICVVGDVTGAQDTVFSGSTQGVNEIVIDIQSTGLVRAFAYNGVSLQIITGTVDVQNSTAVIKLSVSSGIATLYINDVADGSGAWIINGQQSVKCVGARPSGSNFFSGVIANPRVSVNGVDSLNCYIDQKGETIQNRPDASNPITLFNVDQANDWITL